MIFIAYKSVSKMHIINSCFWFCNYLKINYLKFCDMLHHSCRIVLSDYLALQKGVRILPPIPKLKVYRFHGSNFRDFLPDCLLNARFQGHI